MGKSPQYIALILKFRNETATRCSCILLLLIVGVIGLRAQATSMPLVAPTDSNLHSVSPNNTVVKKDTVTQSITAFDSTMKDSGTTVKAKAPLHSSKKAAYLSAVLPGLGQAYNKKYWKIPIVYAGFGGLAYALYYTSTNFQGYKAAYRLQVATVPNPNASFNGANDPATLKDYRDYFKKYLDIAAIGVGVWYLLNIIDATVDAHLMGWNMKDDLSVTWNPTLITSPNYNSAAAGLTVTLHF